MFLTVFSLLLLAHLLRLAVAEPHLGDVVKPAGDVLPARLNLGVQLAHAFRQLVTNLFGRLVLRKYLLGQRLDAVESVLRGVTQ